MNIKTQHIQIAIQALEQLRGDDLYRARIAFKDYTPAEMQCQYGQSGMTCQQILDEYESRDTRIIAAIEWVRNLEQQV